MFRQLPMFRTLPGLLLLAAVATGCGPKSLAEFVAAPEVGYTAACSRKAAEQQKALDDLRYFPPKILVRRWPKELPGGKEATLEDKELAAKITKGEVRSLMVVARGGVGKSTLGRALEAMSCNQIPVFRVDLNQDVASRLAASKGGIPEINTLPWSGARTPRRVSINVVFPEPEGPTTPTEAPGGIERVIFEIAGNFLLG